MDNTAWQLVDGNDTPIPLPHDLQTGRDETWTIRSISQAPGDGSTGKVYAIRPCDHNEAQHAGISFWCSGEYQQEFYPQVFGARILPA